MAKVIIDGVEYIPKADVKPLDCNSLQKCLEVLTSMRYFGQDHKMMGHTWEAINALSPELAKLEPDVAFERIHGNED
jgi:hypothetical protein